MSAGRICSRDVDTAGYDENVLDAARRMRDRQVGTVVVVDEMRPVGIVTDRESFAATPVFFARVLCPICRTEHEWFAKEAWLCEPGVRGR